MKMLAVERRRGRRGCKDSMVLEARVTEKGRLRRAVSWCLAWCEWWMVVVVLLLRREALGEEQDALGNKCSTTNEDEGMIWRFVEKRGARFESLILSQS